MKKIELNRRQMGARKRKLLLASTKAEMIKIIVCHYFNFNPDGFYESRLRDGDRMWVYRFTCLFLRSLLGMSQHEIGFVVKRDHANARAHYVNIIGFIQNNDKVSKEHLYNLLLILMKNGYDGHLVRKYIDEFKILPPPAGYNTTRRRFVGRRKNELVPV